MNNPAFRLDTFLENLSSKMEHYRELCREAQDVLCSDLQTDIASTPYEVLYEEDRVKLKHYKPVTKSQYNYPLFIVYALINRDTVLDLQPGRSVVQNLLENGIDLYMLEWGYPTRKDCFLGIDDHVNGYIHNTVNFILKRHNLSKLNMMGVCMGGTLCTIYSALHPEKVNNLILTVTPTNFDTDTGLLHVWWGNENFDVDRFVNNLGNVPGDFLNFNFLLMNPARLMIDKYMGLMENINNKNFVENFLRMEKWIFDSPDVPGEIFKEFIKNCYQQNLLIQNKLRVGGQLVDLGKITMPVLNIYGQYDHLVPPEACNKITEKVGTSDKEDFAMKTGHIGIYVSSKSQKEFVPRICQWLKVRDEHEVQESSSQKTKTASRSRKRVKEAQSSAAKK